MAAPAVRFEGVERHFGPIRAVDGVDLEIRDGEFFSMLGPSGSGKTTCLRIIGGFERPTAGRVALFGEDVAGVPPFRRAVNTVFQDYALFPHLTIAENVGYGLRLRRVPRAEIRERVDEMLELVHLPGVRDRRPGQLSGGQKQRVALARALVNGPRMLLLDEPLGALDLKLRKAMQRELKAIQRDVGITFVYVTHDQEEALAMSDRLAIFRRGKVEQVGTPVEIYEWPRTAFVADFVGASNRIEGALAERIAGAPGAFVVRPEKVRLEAAGAQVPDGFHRVEGTLADATFLGMVTRYLVDVGADAPLEVMVPNADAHALTVGATVVAAWSPDAVRPVAP